MLLPDKHIRISESLLGLAALALASLKERHSFDSLMALLSSKFETPDWPAFHNVESVSLALCFLYSVGLVDVDTNGVIYRCD